MFNLLLNNGADISIEDEDGRNVLHIVSLNNDCKMATLLLSKKINLNLRDRYKCTALYLSVINED